MAIQLKTGYAMTLVLVALTGGGASALAASISSPTAGAAARLPATPVAQAGPVHPTQALPVALRPVFYRALAKDADAAYAINKDGCAALPKQPLKACFDATGAHFTLPAGQAGGTTPASPAGRPLSLHLAAWGRGDTLASAAVVRPTINANQASYRHGAIYEWWRVLPIGFEQGFTIAKRPSGSGELTLALAASRQDAGLSACGHAQAGAPDKDTLAWGKLRYGDLVVTDAKGKVVPATLTTKGDRVLIAVNDAHAVYPLTVDPLVWLEQKMTANDGVAGDHFGYSVAISGATALVGAPGAASGQGAAYLFLAGASGNWTQIQRLTASDGTVGDGFGSAVAINGANAIVGADWATVNGNYAQGAAYTFSPNITYTWMQTAKLTAGDGAANDNFGYAVALDGTNALVGAPNATVNGYQYEGSAYVFSNASGSWTQVQKLIAGDGMGGDTFGHSVALDGTTALVGAPDCDTYGVLFCFASLPGAVYVFDESDGSWTQTAKLMASDGVNGDAFGWSVALEGTTALIGAPFASGGEGPGAVYVFGRPLGLWTQTQKLTASDGGNGNAFGWSVALSGTTALAGAPRCGSFFFELSCNGLGQAYVFSESDGGWTQTQELTASDGADHNGFGFSAAFVGVGPLVGAPFPSHDDYSEQGAAYFYGSEDLSLAVSEPETVYPGQNYASYTSATNNASATSLAVSATVTVPAAASFISATASQGTCSEASGVVTCAFGPISGNGGTATANVTLKATGAPGTTIENTASVALATPPLTAGLPTAITCPAAYTTYVGTLAPSAWFHTPSYPAPGGEENAILTAPSGFGLYVHVHVLYDGIFNHHFLVPEVHHWGPAGTYFWGVKAGAVGGAYTLCILHP